MREIFQNGDVNRIIFPIFLFLVFFSALVMGKTKAYEGSLSSLIGIWEGFYEINPNQVDSGFVVFKSGGYDGQFFYFLAKDMFVGGDWDIILDSYYFRWHRIGLSFVSGGLSTLFGFQHYPVLTLSILFSTFIASFLCLRSLLPLKSRAFALIYLFSPYSINSNLLLVADSFFVSLAIIGYFFYKRSRYFSAIVFFTMAVFTRELGILFLLPVSFRFFVTKDYKRMFLFALPIFFFGCFLLYGRFFTPNHLGTNPLSFTDMIDFPFFGFFKSFVDSGEFHFQTKEFPKFIFLFSFLLVGFSLRKANVSDLYQSELLIPILGSLFVIFIAEEGYWRSFDNLSRMFTLILPLTLLYQSEKSFKSFQMFWALSILLMAFIPVRVFFISPGKEFFFAP
ncbi:MAG: hypothetical protein O9301_11880 [Leptospira sp.]|nr:hypothetical protein [Leptospira sp.]